jgi:predicted transposase/invertase (TIGR01784 family)
MLSKFLDPKNDMAFKKIFGTEKNQEILIHFLNDMLVFKAGKPIIKVTFLKTVQDPEIAAKKTSIVDIMCTDEVGNQYIVEMQVAEGKDFVKRAQYYAAKAYSSQLNVGVRYNNLKEIIFLAITNFVMFPDKQEFKSDHVILDKATNEHDLKDFSFTFLELAKFKKTKEELTSIIDRWSYFFKNAQETSEKDLQQIIGQDSIIQKAYEELNKFSWSEEELLSYEAVIKREMDHQAILEKQYDDALAKGLAEGLAEGKAEGKMEIIISMLKEGINIELISKITNIVIK